MAEPNDADADKMAAEWAAMADAPAGDAAAADAGGGTGAGRFCATRPRSLAGARGTT